MKNKKNKEKWELLKDFGEKGTCGQEVKSLTEDLQGKIRIFAEAYCPRRALLFEGSIYNLYSGVEIRTLRTLGDTHRSALTMKVNKEATTAYEKYNEYVEGKYNFNPVESQRKFVTIPYWNILRIEKRC